MWSDIQDLINEIKRMDREIQKLKQFDVPKSDLIMLDAWRTNAAWESTTHSTTAKTLINLATTFSLPSQIKSVVLYILWNDSGSAGTDCFIIFANNAVANNGMGVGPYGLPNSKFAFGQLIIPCTADGNIYYQIKASGVNTLTTIVRPIGYQR